MTDRDLVQAGDMLVKAVGYWPWFQATDRRLGKPFTNTGRGTIGWCPLSRQGPDAPGIRTPRGVPGPRFPRRGSPTGSGSRPTRKVRLYLRLRNYRPHSAGRRDAKVLRAKSRRGLGTRAGSQRRDDWRSCSLAGGRTAALRCIGTTARFPFPPCEVSSGNSDRMPAACSTCFVVPLMTSTWSGSLADRAGTRHAPASMAVAHETTRFDSDDPNSAATCSNHPIIKGCEHFHLTQLASLC